MSYIVKNCPGKCFIGATNMKCSDLGGDCDTHVDCVIKKTVKTCKRTISDIEFLLKDSGDWWDECVHGILKNIKERNEMLLEALDVEDVG